MVLGLLSPALAQPTPPAPTTPPASSSPAATQPLPAPLILARRVDGVRAFAKLSNAVVIVRDSASYLDAIGHWTISNRFPVLIDDGTDSARENIARFVRGFQPAKVVRYAMKDAAPGFPPTMSIGDLQTTTARAWDVPKEHASLALLQQRWLQLKFEPPGMVLMQENDPAWTAAVALAAGRGQLIVGVTCPGGVDGAFNLADADELERTAAAAAEASGYAWRTLGDAIDAITLCINCPDKLDTGKPGEFFAITDRLGRDGRGIEDGHRWAWCGHIFGNAQEAAYRAMCSLFISTHRAWVFDGYPVGEPWSFWDGTKAAKILREVGLTADLDDAPRQGAHDWRVRTARAVNAELILVNTKGNCDFFDLEPGRCFPGDVPVLNVPAAVHFVHSWSAQFPQARGTVGGRWLERGAFCYAGSVNEPYLQAFLPTPSVAGRLVSGAPFGAAVRQDNGKLWKVTTLGDPLFVTGKDIPRVDTLPLENTQEVGDGLRELLKAGKFEEAMTTLTLLGKDTEAAELVESLIKTKPDAVTPAVAALGVPALFRAGHNQGVVRIFDKLGDRRTDPILRDMLWLAAYPLLGAPDEPLLRTLHNTIRADAAGRDATVLAAAWERKNGRSSMDAMLADLRRGLTPDQQKSLDEAMKAPFEQWGR